MALRVLQRTLVLLASLVVSSVLVFAFMALLPGDPARVALGVNASDQAVAALRQDFGPRYDDYCQRVRWRMVPGVY